MSVECDHDKNIETNPVNTDDNAHIERNDDGINVEEIMENIRNSVRQQRSRMDDNELDALLNNLLQYSNVSNGDYVISSHRRFIGPILISGRKLVNAEIRRYVDPTMIRQTYFNQSATKLLENVNSRLNTLSQKHDALESMNVKERLETIEKKLKENEDPSWSKFYDIEVNEKFLNDNVEFHKEFISLIEEYSNKSSGGKVPRLLEVGLGTATFSIYFSRSAYCCVGIDNDPSIIEKSISTNKKLGGYVRFVLIDALDLDLFKNGYFDVAFSQGTLEHFDNETLFKILSNQLSVARYVVFSVPSRYWPDREFGNERKMEVQDWKKLLDNAGFNVLYINYYHDKTQIACVIGPGTK